LPPDDRQPHDLTRQLLVRQIELEARINRIEKSAPFRALRWVGEKSGYANLIRTRAGNDEDYSTWVEQSAWLDPFGSECAHRTAAWDRAVRLTYLVGSVDAAESAANQLVPPVEVLQFNNEESWQKAVCSARAEYSVVVPSYAHLSPLAAYRWGELLQDSACDAAYSDWDHVEASGRRHSPRFTPELSPQLLSQASYWGGCFLARTGLLKELSDCPPASLPLRLADAAQFVVRVPYVLWHSMSTPVELHANARSLMGDPAEASIVICSRTPRLLQRCLETLRRSDAAQAEIVVVAHDCGRADKLKQIAVAHSAHVVPYSGRFHFGLMNALGAAQSSRPTIVFLNDDVEPIAPGWLGALEAMLRRKDIGIAGGLLVYPSGAVQHAGITVGGWPTPAHLGRGQLSSSLWPWLRITREVSAVSGACLAIRRTLWDELGGFDRRFPDNYNDVDLCLRARRAGYSVVLECGALLCHREAQTRSAEVTSAERALFCSLWPNALASPDPFFNPNLMLRHDRIALVVH